MITYKKMLKLLIDMNLKKRDLIEMAKLSPTTMAKMNSNRYVSLEIIDRICASLDCQPGDLIEYVPTPKITNLSGIKKGTSDYKK